MCSGVSRVWQAWHVPWAPLWRGRKIAWKKIKTFTYSFLNLYFAPHTFIGHIYTVTLLNALSRPCCTSTTKNYDKLWYCDTTRRSDIVTEQGCSLTVSTKLRSCQCCQLVYIHTKLEKFGIFSNCLVYKFLIWYIWKIWYIFDIFWSEGLVEILNQFIWSITKRTHRSR